MANCDEIKKVARKVYPSSLHRGCFDLSPPVRLVDQKSQAIVGAWLIDPKEEMVCLIGIPGSFYASNFKISEKQGRLNPPEISNELLDELETLLNYVSNEREQYDNGPTHNARLARDMLDKLWLTRHK